MLQTPQLMVCKARAVSRLAPRRGRPPTRLGDRCRFGWDGLPADVLGWGASGLAVHPHGLGQRPRHRQHVSMATAAREQHEGRGRHLGCTTPTRTADPAGLLRRAAGPCKPGRAWLRRRPWPRRQPPVPRDLIAGSSSSRRQRQGCSASNERGLASGAGHPGSLAKLSSSSPRSALQRRRVRARTTYKLRGAAHGPLGIRQRQHKPRHRAGARLWLLTAGVSVLALVVALTLPTARPVIR